MGSVPLYAALHKKSYDSENSTQYDHGVQADQASFEKVAERHRLSYAVVVGISNDESG